MTHRDVASSELLTTPASVEGRKVVAVVGIDHYKRWPVLNNAVSDARGALHVFRRLGFEPLVGPLTDGAATADAIRRLVIDDLATKLASNDSLVLFFAGHGHTRTRVLQSGPVETGFLIPVDGEPPDGHAATWLRLDSLLSDVARLPARHILVLLDACHSGIALGALIKWRGVNSGATGAGLADLHSRQSRRVITSALGDQRAMDSGPVPGHSLFTGYVIEGLTGGLAQAGRCEATGSELGLYVQQRVAAHTASKQTPDFGALELDDRGELVLPLVPGPAPAVVVSSDAPAVERDASAPSPPDAVSPPRGMDTVARVPAASRPEWLQPLRSLGILAARFVGLCAVAVLVGILTTRTGNSVGIAIIAAVVALVIVAILGRVVPVVPTRARQVISRPIRKPGWIAAVVVGAAAGMYERAALDDEAARVASGGSGVPAGLEVGQPALPVRVTGTLYDSRHHSVIGARIALDGCATVPSVEVSPDGGFALEPIPAACWTNNHVTLVAATRDAKVRREITPSEASAGVALTLADAAPQLVAVTGQKFGYLITTSSPLAGNIIRSDRGWTMFADASSSGTRFYAIDSTAHPPAVGDEVTGVVAVEPRSLRVPDAALSDVVARTANAAARHLLFEQLRSEAGAPGATDDCATLRRAQQLLTRALSLEAGRDTRAALEVVQARIAVVICP